MSLEDTKKLLGVDNERVSIVYDYLQKRLLSRLNRTEDKYEEIPLELEYIVTECAIARYNRIGSEGMASESMDGHSATYEDKDLSDYEGEIRTFLQEDASVGRRGRVTFL